MIAARTSYVDYMSPMESRQLQAVDVRQAQGVSLRDNGDAVGASASGILGTSRHEATNRRPAETFPRVFSTHRAQSSALSLCSRARYEY